MRVARGCLILLLFGSLAGAALPSGVRLHAHTAQAGRSGGPASVAATRAAQGRLTGVVTDASGSALAGVEVVLLGTDRTAPLTVVTDERGRFEFTNLAPGRFDISCRADGFQPWHLEGVEVGLSRAATVNVRMLRRTDASDARETGRKEEEQRRREEAPGRQVPGERPHPPVSAPAEPATGTRPLIPHSGAPTRAQEPPRAPAAVEPAIEPHEPAAPQPAAAEPVETHRLLADIDSYLAKMDVGSIAFNAPEHLIVGETTEVHLLLSPTLSVAALQQQLQNMPGVLQGAEIRIAPVMSALLTGQQFAITAITPETQSVSRGEQTEWRWEVSPKGAGALRLHLTLNATVNGSPRMLRTFDRTIEVDVTLRQRVSGFIGDNWQWLWATLLVPMGGWLWRRRARNRT